MNRLVVSKLTSIGAVEEGDNPHAKIMLFKRKNADSDNPSKEPDMADDPTVEDLQKQVDDLTSEVARLNGEEAAPEPVADPAIQKMLDEQSSVIAKLQSDAEKRDIDIAKERDERLTADMTSITKKYETVLGTEDDTVDMLKAVHGSDAYDWLMKRVGLVTEVLAKSDLFKEMGADDASDDGRDQIDALAKVKQEQNPDLTDAQARVLVRQERRDLQADEREDK